MFLILQFMISIYLSKKNNKFFYIFAFYELFDCPQRIPGPLKKLLFKNLISLFHLVSEHTFTGL